MNIKKIKAQPNDDETIKNLIGKQNDLHQKMIFQFIICLIFTPILAILLGLHFLGKDYLLFKNYNEFKKIKEDIELKRTQQLTSVLPKELVPNRTVRTETSIGKIPTQQFSKPESLTSLPKPISSHPPETSKSPKPSLLTPMPPLVKDEKTTDTISDLVETVEGGDEKINPKSQVEPLASSSPSDKAEQEEFERKMLHFCGKVRKMYPDTEEYKKFFDEVEKRLKIIIEEWKNLTPNEREKQTKYSIKHYAAKSDVGINNLLRRNMYLTAEGKFRLKYVDTQFFKDHFNVNDIEDFNPNSIAKFIFDSKIISLEIKKNKNKVKKVKRFVRLDFLEEILNANIEIFKKYITDEEIEFFKENIDYYREVRLLTSNDKTKKFEETLKKFVVVFNKENIKYTDNALLSTTTRDNISLFGTFIEIVFNVKKASGMDISEISDTSNEDEVLFSKDHEIEFTEITFDTKRKIPMVFNANLSKNPKNHASPMSK
ncbi:MAG: hypothetical protein LBJ09_03945 [Clostridiales bacterium]|jgi:hypothetical protein|nr:hypothetical protein [Clostridiales bacterium]